MQIEHALTLYAQQLRADGRSMHTVNQAHRHVLLLARWAASEGPGCDLAALDHEALARFLGSDAARLRPDGRAKKPTSANALRSSIRSFLRYCHDAGYVRQDPGRLIRRARCGPGPPRALTVGEQERFLAVLAKGVGPEARRDELLARLLLGAGLRLGEAVALDDADLDLDAGQLWLRSTKSGRPARAFLPADLTKALRAHVAAQGQGPLFQARHGERISTRHARRRLVAALERAGVRRPAGPHSLRHSFATSLLGRTGDLALVQAALRNRSIAATTVYVEVPDERLRAAVGAI